MLSKSSINVGVDGRCQLKSVRLSIFLNVFNLALLASLLVFRLIIFFQHVKIFNQRRLWRLVSTKEFLFFILSDNFGFIFVDHVQWRWLRCFLLRPLLRRLTLAHIARQLKMVIGITTQNIILLGYIINVLLIQSFCSGQRKILHKIFRYSCILY